VLALFVRRDATLKMLSILENRRARPQSAEKLFLSVNHLTLPTDFLSDAP
jgi:hypothetical protein